MAPRRLKGASVNGTANGLSVVTPSPKDEEVERTSRPKRNRQLVTSTNSQDSPLLPIELLESVPDQVQSKHDQDDNLAVDASEAEKEDLMKQLRDATKGTGVLKAGEAAQMKRGVPRAGDKVKTGRVQKKRKDATKSVVSGKQRMVEERKRAASSVSQSRPPAKRRSKKKG